MASQALHLAKSWAGFDLMKVGVQEPMTYKRADLLLISGCITTTMPANNKAGIPMNVAYVNKLWLPAAERVFFLAPPAMSRYEDIYQCGTSMTLGSDGKFGISFNKRANPMMLYWNGFCCNISREEATNLIIGEHDKRDWADGA